MQPLFELAQLLVIERAGCLFTITRDERHRSTTIKQSHGGLDLLLTNTKRFRYLPMNGFQDAHLSGNLRPINRNRRPRNKVHMFVWQLIFQPQLEPSSPVENLMHDFAPVRPNDIVRGSISGG